MAQVSDPFAAWRDWMSQSERQWNSFFNDAMATEEFSRSMGRMMDVFLSTQSQMNESLGRYLTAMNIPTRGDITALGDRLHALEDRLIAIEASLAAIRAGTPVAPPAAAPGPIAPAPVASRPPRTKKPPANTQ